MNDCSCDHGFVPFTEKQIVRRFTAKWDGETETFTDSDGKSVRYESPKGPWDKDKKKQLTRPDLYEFVAVDVDYVEGCPQCNPDWKNPYDAAHEREQAKKEKEAKGKQRPSRDAVSAKTIVEQEKWWDK